MDTVWIAIGAALLALGFLGCVLPVLPGVTLAYLGLVSLALTKKPGVPITMLVIGLALVAVATVLDMVIPAIGTKKLGGSKWGVFGCTVGAIVGLFFTPWGLVLGPFLGAVAGEVVSGKHNAAAFKAGAGAFLGFLCGTVLKLIICALFTFWFIHAFFT
jgi:uncharacterized protein YqgC (DUF456 family)